jgi:hypothetical protein
MQNYAGLIEVALTFLLLGGFCLWELRSLRKLRERREAEKREGR